MSPQVQRRKAFAPAEPAPQESNAWPMMMEAGIPERHIQGSHHRQILPPGSVGRII